MAFIYTGKTNIVVANGQPFRRTVVKDSLTSFALFSSKSNNKEK